MGDPKTNPPVPLPPGAAAASAEAAGEPIRRNIRARRMSRQLSLSEIPRDVEWERQKRRRHKGHTRKSSDVDVLTDEDLKELKGCIDLGFGFNEENGQLLCDTIPALDLYFAVNRVLSPTSTSNSTDNVASTPAPPPSLEGGSEGGGQGGSGSAMGSRSSSIGSSLNDSDSWKICNPGDDPQDVKTKLRHWAQVVACSVKQAS